MSSGGGTVPRRRVAPLPSESPVVRAAMTFVMPMCPLSSIERHITAGVARCTLASPCGELNNWFREMVSTGTSLVFYQDRSWRICVRR